ncbi:MAG: TetR/AcrR family transcriptional regulator [Chloroflexota bacterium]
MWPTRGEVEAGGRPAFEAKADEIVSVAARLFRERGYHSTTMGDIGAAVGMNKGSLYYYFESKEDVLYRVIFRVARILDRIEHIAALELPAAERLRLAARAHLKYTAEHWDSLLVLMQHTRDLAPDHQRAALQMRRRYDAALRRLIEDGIGAGEFRPLDAGLATLGALGMWNWTFQWYRPRGRLKPEAIADAFTDLLLRGLLSPTPP